MITFRAPQVTRCARKFAGFLVLLTVIGCLPESGWASFTAHLAWNASHDSKVTGYRIYYGTDGVHFTNVVSEGTNISAAISGLAENILYVFSATSIDRAGHESSFSDKVTFVGASAVPRVPLALALVPPSYTSDSLVFSLGSNAPAGAAIDPKSGIVSWTPGNAYRETTNFIHVYAADLAHPSLSITGTLEVMVGDFLNLQLGKTSVLVSQMASVPISLAACRAVTNVQFSLKWQADQLQNPTLSVASPFVAGSLSLQDDLLVVQLQTPAGRPFSGSQEVAQLGFQAASSQPSSSICELAIATASGNGPEGVTYGNASTHAGEVVLVGGQPLLRPDANASSGRNLLVYANPGTYQLLSTPSLAEPITWQRVLTYQQSNSLQTVSVDRTLPQVFYQLQQVPSEAAPASVSTF